MTAQEKPLYSLIPLEDFKTILGVDSRDDKLSGFCLVTATFTIEQYCKRRFIRKKHFELIEYTGELLLPFREYPVSKVLSIYAMSSMGGFGEILEPEFYSVIPDCDTDYDLPFSLSLSPTEGNLDPTGSRCGLALKRYRNLQAIKAVYWAGYAQNKVPPDLASVCMELAAWNMNRYRGRRIGMTGNVRGSGKEGEHFEMSLPENVRSLLEPYRRKVI